MYSNNTQSRKWFITINNPAEHGFDHAAIRAILMQMKSITYWCMGDEKHHTNLPDTHEEWGEIPDEKQYIADNNKGSMADLYEMIKSGMSNTEILDIYPQFLPLLDKINKCRQCCLNEKYKNIYRRLDVTYMWGATGAGKTRGIFDKYEKYSDVCRITDYTQPFDSYEMQDVVVFDEFRSSLKLPAMLNYLDGYPLDLPCRFYNKVAAYTKVYIASNIDLCEQYTSFQRREQESWKAFLRRIHHVIVFDGNTKKEYSMEEYLKKSMI